MILPVIVLAMSAAATALPQSANTVQTPHEPTITSEIFVGKAAMSGLFEVEAAKLALTRSRDPAVRDFAQKMVTDHNAAGVELTGIVAKKTYSLGVPMLLDSDHQAKLKKLDKESAKDFDAAYGQLMREGHEEAVNAFTMASAESLVDADLRAYATRTLPTLHAHQELARKLPAPEKK